jgi:hypothetical protein
LSLKLLLDWAPDSQFFGALAQLLSYSQGFQKLKGKSEPRELGQILQKILKGDYTKAPQSLILEAFIQSPGLL